LALPAVQLPGPFSSAYARLIAQDGIVTEHPDDDCTFRQFFDLYCGLRLIGGAVLDNGRTNCL
jgi:hypothetical protein